MKSVWLYMVSVGNPLKYFFINEAKPISLFCIFSSRELILKHSLKQKRDYFMPEAFNDEDEWTEQVIDAAPLEKLEEWHKEYNSEDDIFEMPLDTYKD